MTTHLGRILELTRYPVKSMAGIVTETVTLGWHGIAGDRRFAFRRIDDGGAFPWLTASRFPELLLYHPTAFDESTGEPLPARVRTPSGRELELQSPELQAEVSERSGFRVELMHLKHGIFDDASVSVISRTTIERIGLESGSGLDRRRFRANVVIETDEPEPFLEDRWIGGTLVFGDFEQGPAVTLTARDPRCVMVNLDPETAAQDRRVMKAVVKLNDNCAGTYGTVVQVGGLFVGQTVSLRLDSSH